MKIIKVLSAQIKDELHDAEKYAKTALEHKTENTALAATYYRLANAELDHAAMLHDDVTREIEKAKSEKTIPPVMYELWAWKHSELIDEEKEVRLLLEMYKGK